MSKTLAYTLTIEFHPDEAGYLAFFPALPGCHSWGSTYEEAVKNDEEALIGYLEALQKDAAREGFQLIAQKASAALQARGNRASREVGN